jgi:hypothetical protein
MLFILSYRFYIDIFSNSTLCKKIVTFLLDRKNRQYYNTSKDFLNLQDKNQ